MIGYLLACGDGAPGFVSRASDVAQYPDGGSFATAACAGGRRIDGFVAVEQGDFGARPQAPADVCVQSVRSCDLFLAVIGVRYGSPVPGRADGMSYTEFEFTVAAARGFPAWSSSLTIPHRQPPIFRRCAPVTLSPFGAGCGTRASSWPRSGTRGSSRLG
jgi:hypothetical protein